MKTPFAPSRGTGTSVEYNYFIRADVSKFAGKWIAIKGEKIVADDENIENLVKKIEKKGISNPLYTPIPKKGLCLVL